MSKTLTSLAALPPALSINMLADTIAGKIMNRCVDHMARTGKCPGRFMVFGAFDLVGRSRETKEITEQGRALRSLVKKHPLYMAALWMTLRPRKKKGRQ